MSLVSGVQALSFARPYSYRTVSPDGQFVFIMIGSYSSEEEPTHWIGELAAEIRAIRQKYTVGGMYRNDDSTTPIWTVDWYAYRIDVPAGGEVVVRYGSGGLETNTGPALGFYRRGELIRGYDVSDLVTLPWFSDRRSWLAEHHLNDDSRSVTVETETGDRYVFDVQTGEMISRFRPIRYLIVAIICTAVLGVLWWRRRRRRRTTPIAAG